MPVLTDTADMKNPGAFRYPHQGDPKPKPGTRVMLIRADKTHVVGEWTDNCVAWAPRSAADRLRDKKEAA
jgi:hypothetical protein